MTRRARIACFPFVLGALALLGCSPVDAESKDTDLAALAFIAGSWAGVDGKVEMEELWMAPKGGTMLGLHRDVVDGRSVSFEFLRIEKTPKGIVYSASPKGGPATNFLLVECVGNRAVFENPQHDFPQRILYWLDAEGFLHARVEGPKTAAEKAQEWKWARVKGDGK